MSVHYTRQQRKTAKDKGLGLITVSVFDPEKGTITVDGPASKAVMKIVDKAIGKVIGKWVEENKTKEN